MNDVEADIGTPGPRIAVVLDKCIQEHSCGERIVHARADEVRLVMTVCKTDVVMREIDAALK